MFTIGAKTGTKCRLAQLGYPPLAKNDSGAGEARLRRHFNRSQKTAGV
jgi:hypothetical protein